MKSFRVIPTAITLAEVGADGVQEIPKRIELLRVGRYERVGFFGDRSLLTIDTELLSSLKKNFDAKTLRIDPAVDYSHANWDKAAGWIRGVELSDDNSTLYIVPEWTPAGKQSVLDKEFCYISAEFHPDYRDNETGKSYGPTLFGAGLTNRPFIKGMKSVELSETQEDATMTEQEIKELQEKLAESEAKVVSLTTDVTSLTEKVQKNEETIKAAEQNKTFDKMLSEGKACEAQRAAFLNGDMAAFAANAKAVKLDEAGHGGEGGEEEGGDINSKTPAQDKVLSLAEKARKENPKLDEQAAISQVLLADEKLNAEYVKETTI